MKPTFVKCPQSRKYNNKNVLGVKISKFRYLKTFDPQSAMHMYDPR